MNCRPDLKKQTRNNCPLSLFQKNDLMSFSNRKYKPRVGEFSGQSGVMVSRVCDISNNDIQLQFNCGARRWFRFADVTEADTEQKPLIAISSPGIDKDRAAGLIEAHLSKFDRLRDM